jgi:hypothetical protein
LVYFWWWSQLSQGRGGDGKIAILLVPRSSLFFRHVAADLFVVLHWVCDVFFNYGVYYYYFYWYSSSCCSYLLTLTLILCPSVVVVVKKKKKKMTEILLIHA